MSHSQTTGVRRGLTAVSSDAGQRGPAYNNSDTQHLGTINLPPSPGTTLAWYTPAAATLPSLSRRHRRGGLRRAQNKPSPYGMGWLGSRVVSMLDSGAEGPGFKSQLRRCRVTVLGKLFTPTVPLITKQQNW